MKYVLYLSFLVFFAACGQSDEKIASEVNSKLTSGNANVSATVADGIVTITGTCPDEACKTSSEAAVKDVKGVKQVVNNISVTPPPPPVTINTDDSLNTAVTEAIKKYKNVKADISDGVVTLTGDIKRSDLPNLMQDVTATKPKRIENKLQIK